MKTDSKHLCRWAASSLPHYYWIRIVLWLSDQQSAGNQQLHYKRSSGKFLSQILLLTPITLPWSELWVRGKRLRWMLCFPPKLVITIITIKTFAPNLYPISPWAIQIQGGLEELICPSLSFKIPTEAFSLAPNSTSPIPSIQQAHKFSLLYIPVQNPFRFTGQCSATFIVLPYFMRGLKPTNIISLYCIKCMRFCTQLGLRPIFKKKKFKTVKRNGKVNW